MAVTATAARDRLLKMDFKTVLDIGSGSGVHAEAFRAADREVTTLDIAPPADFVCDYLSYYPKRDNFDCIWAAHILEHQLNVNEFLSKCYWDLKDGGILAITVPPAKHEIVGGHLTIWNEGLLLYNLILAGFDCSKAMVGVDGYNISVIVRKNRANYPKLNYDRGDIELLAPFFPIQVEQNFNGRTGNINWD
jgi:SAM-dependent methyltransferase